MQNPDQQETGNSHPYAYNQVLQDSQYKMIVVTLTRNIISCVIVQNSVCSKMSCRGPIVLSTALIKRQFKSSARETEKRPKIHIQVVFYSQLFK